MELDIDNHKLMYHPERVAEWLKEKDCYPIYVEIGLTNLCNHKCIFCGLDWARGKETLETKLLLKTLADLARHKIKSICYSGAGEPLLHKDFSLFVKKTKESGIDVSFSTNGVLFDETKAKETLPYASWIRFSIDAASPETHSKIHRCSEKDFSSILNNLHKATELKKINRYNATLGVQFILLKENAHELLKSVQLYKDIGADNLQIKPYSHHPLSSNDFSVNYSQYLHLKEELEKFNSDKFKVFFRKDTLQRIKEGATYDYCYGLPFFTVINEKGDVQPCLLFYDYPEFSYGNLYKQSFSEIWRGEKRKEILKKLNQKGVKECRKGCRLDANNKYLYRLKNPESHDNFI